MHNSPGTCGQTPGVHCTTQGLAERRAHLTRLTAARMLSHVTQQETL